MRTIVCYGDSNTWGYLPRTIKPEAGLRYPPEVRWAGRLQAMLGCGWRVEEEGLNGRTTVFDDPMEAGRNGLETLDACLRVNAPADLVILMLGTNDVKEHLGQTAYSIGKGMGMLAARARASGCGPKGAAPEVLVICPPHLGGAIEQCWLGEEFGPHALEKDRKLAGYYRQAAMENGASFLDASALLTLDTADCVHLSEDGHRVMAEAVLAKVREIFKEPEA